MTLFYRYPNLITDIVCAGVVAGDWSKIDDAYDAPDATKDADWVVMDGGSSTYTGDGWQCTFGNMASFGSTINSVTLCVRWGSHVASTHGTIRYGLQVSGSYYYDTSITGAGNTRYNLTKVFLVNPFTGLQWKLSELAAIKARFYDNRTTLGYDNVYSVYLIVDASPPNPTALTAARQVASARLRSDRRPRKIGTLTGHLSMLERSPFDLLEVEDIAGPDGAKATAAANGWGEKTWERRQMEIREMTLSFMNGTVQTKVADQRDVAALIWFPAYSSKPSGVLEDGVPRMHTPGSTFSFTRASDQTFTNVAGVSETVTTDVPAYTDKGLAMLNAAAPLVQSYTRFSNLAAARTWPAAQGTAFCEVNFPTAVSAGLQALLAARYDANNMFYVAWNGALNRWSFYLATGGVFTEAYLADAPAINTWYKLGIRWTGSNSENGVAARTQSLYANGTKGTDGTFTAAPVETASPTYGVEVGAVNALSNINGYIRNVLVVPQAYTDIEMQRMTT